MSSFTGYVGVPFSDYWSFGATQDTWFLQAWGISDSGGTFPGSGGSLPAGIYVNQNFAQGRAVISGTPTQAGVYNAVVVFGSTNPVTKEMPKFFSYISERSVTFTVLDTRPIITAGQTASGVVGTAFSKTFSLTDSANRPVTGWSATGLPSWAMFNTTTGTITGTPQDTGSATISLTATGPGGTSAATTATVSISNSVGVKLLRKVVVGGLSVEPDNEVTLRGARYTNARWTREGSIPLGLNWGSSAEGLRFWGTPQESGEMSAIFEGPYPDGFQSNRTDAGQQSGGAVGCAKLDAAGSFLVDRYEVKFLVEEPADNGMNVLPSDFTLGEVLAELLTNTSSQWARRSAWTGGVRIGTRGGTASITSSNSAALVPASVPASKKPPLFYTDNYLVQAGLLTPTDMAASDWKFALPAAMYSATPRSGQGVLRTAGAQVQSLAAETTASYADYVGESLDGVRRVCAFQAEIPLLPGVCWGEFYLRAGFTGSVQVLYYTTEQGAVTDRLAAPLGLKFFYRVQESTAATYRSARTGLPYDFLSGAEQICRASLPLEGRHGVYRLQVPQDVAPGAMASLSIIVKGDV